MEVRNFRNFPVEMEEISNKNRKPVFDLGFIPESQSQCSDTVGNAVTSGILEQTFGSLFLANVSPSRFVFC